VGDDFKQETDAWGHSGLNSGQKIYTQCDGIWLLGGHYVLFGNIISPKGTQGKYFERKYTGLGNHNQLNLTYFFFPIDSWVITFAKSLSEKTE